MNPWKKKILGVPNWVQNGGFYHFFKVASLTNHITQDCRSGQCLTSSRGETSRKKICGPSWGPLKLACFSWCWFTSKRLQRGILWEKIFRKKLKIFWSKLSVCQWTNMKEFKKTWHWISKIIKEKSWFDWG